MTTLKAEISEPVVEDVAVTDETLSVDLADGRTISVPLTWYPRLLHGTAEERNNWRLIADGEGIHWPDLDEDISAENLVLGKRSGESQASLQRWLEQRDKPHSYRIPAHACDPPASRDDPLFINTIDVSLHRHPEEQQMFHDIKSFVESSGERIAVREGRMLDADSYLVINIGVGIAANFVSDFIRYLVRRLRQDIETRRRPVIYIAPAYAPKKVFRLPEQADEATEWLRSYPSRSNDSVES